MAKKKREKKQKFVPANEQQSAGIDAGRNFIETGNPEEFFVLMGKAGTGKTTIAQEIVAPYIKKKHVIIAALSHKAKIVLAEKLNKRFGRRAIQAETIASLLGMTMDLDSGKFRIGKGDEFKDPPISEASIIIIDECSMVNEEALKYIMEMKKPSAIVIFLGDIGQLPPIREGHDRFHDHPSPTFNTKNKATLTERVRQGEESPILPYADLFWNNSQSKSPVENPALNGSRKSIVNDKGSLVFSKSANAFDKVLPLFKEAVEKGNPDIVRVVVYQNKTRMIVNDKIRKFLFGEESKNQYVVGDIVMFQDNFTYMFKFKISNSTEVQVKRVREKVESDGWKAWYLGIVLDGTPMEIPVLDNDDKSKFALHLNQIAEKAKAMASGPDRTDMWKKFYREKERFAPIEHGYGITSHKCQGSTYDVTLIGESDIMSLAVLTGKTKSQSIYTAITRSKYLTVIMDGVHDEPEMLDKAIRMLEKQRN